MSVSMEGRVAYISGGSCMMARGTATAFLEAGGKVVLGEAGTAGCRQGGSRQQGLCGGEHCHRHRQCHRLGLHPELL